MISIFVLILGLVVGSFLNVVIYRLKNGGRIIADRSKCPYCKKELQVLDLIPVLSFLFFKGRCRYCKKKISWQYPLVELTTALSFILIFLNINFLGSSFPAFALWGDIILFLFFVFYLSSLIVIFVYDLRYYLIPDVVLLPAILLVLAILVFAVPSSYFFILDNFFGALVFSGFFLAQYLISKGKWVGGGDVKLGILLGLILGWKLALVSLFIAYVTGAIVASALILLKKKTRKDVLAFGPFLIASFIIVLFYGQVILSWYLGF